MAGKETLSRIQQKGSEIKNAPGALKQSITSGADKALSPFTQKKQELDAALQKAHAPFEAMKAQQQQAQQSMDAAKKQADAAKKVLEGKELLYGMAKDVSDKTMNDTQSTLKKAQQGMEDREKEYQNAGTVVKDLLAKIEAQARSAAGDAGRAPGGNR
jgi:chromosome segregation ATPase